MTDYLRRQLLGFDIESTGVNEFEDRIVSFSMVYSESQYHLPVIKEWTINPGVAIPTEASDVHGITNEYVLEHGLDPKLALQDIANKIEVILHMGYPLVAFNCTFDITMLLAEFERYSINFSLTPEQAFSKVIDPLVIDKAIDKYRKGSRKLVDMAIHYGYGEFNAHESTADVLATLHITRRLAEKLPEAMSIELLQDFQRDSKLEQASSLQTYLRKKEQDDTIVINTQWPYQTKAVND